MNKYRCRKIFFNRNFTIVELLVVIAIITILASLLFPALSKSQELVRVISCKNNMKQIFIGLSNYLENSKGSFPSGVTQMIHFYIFEQIYPSKTSLSYSVKTAFICPSAKKEQLQSLSYSTFNLTNAYSLNDAPGRPNPTIKIDMFKQPSAFLYAADGIGSFNTTQTDLDVHIYYRHASSNINALFLDGHADSKKYKIMQTPSSANNVGEIRNTIYR